MQSSDELSLSTTEGESSHACSSTTAAQQGSSSTHEIVIDDDETKQHNISLKLTAAGIFAYLNTVIKDDKSPSLHCRFTLLSIPADFKSDFNLPKVGLYARRGVCFNICGGDPSHPSGNKVC